MRNNFPFPLRALCRTGLAISYESKGTMDRGYTNEEYADMHFMYGKANGSALEAARLYEEAFPRRRQPDRRMFIRLHQRLTETGSFAHHVREGRPRSITPYVEERVLRSVHERPSTSTRRIATQERVLSHSSVWRILHRQLLYPYHLQRVQALNNADFPPRENFCQWMQQQCTLNPLFVSSILFTDEAGFTRDGIFNFHNCHIWADVNPNATHVSRHQQRFSLNVWAGLLGDRIIGPHFLPQRLNGQRYRRFLRTVLPDLLHHDDVPLNQRLNMWFMHDGAPAHFQLRVRRLLTRRYGQHWIGRGGPVPWPPRSPDLNPMDFCVWGHVKSLVYATEVNSLEELRLRIEAAFQHLQNSPGLPERIRNSFHRRVQCCIQTHGQHFEHLL